MNTKSLPTEEINYSSTVRAVRTTLEDRSAVSSVEIINTILKSHYEYANRTSANLESYHPSEQKHINDWLVDIEQLFDPSLMKSSEQLLDGRLVILGLAMLEHELWEVLQINDFLPKLTNEVNKKLPGEITTLLSSEGERLWRHYSSFSNNVSTNEVPFSSEVPALNENENLSEEQQLDRTQNYTDDPKVSLEEDLLGREAYSNVLAKIIKDIPGNTKDSYALHLYGAWGSGKSTLLNFIKAKLDEDKWLIVDFNAWSYQHISPPWWSLLDAIFQKAKEKDEKRKFQRAISYRTIVKEYIWRLTMGETVKPVIILILAVLIGYVLYSSSNPDFSELGGWKDNLEHLSKILISIGAIW